jgi:DNA processing protein
MTVHDIALTMQPAIGPHAAAHLIEVFGTADEIYTATLDELVEKAQLRPDIARALLKKEHHVRAEKELRHCQREGITALAATDPDYPELLRECVDRPHVIYFRGDPAVLRRPMLSMVGTRNMTAYGQKMCDRLVNELASLRPDIVIVSGLAHGIDGACHRAALATGMATVGVIATPLHDITPPAHARMADEMARRGGGILTEIDSQRPIATPLYLHRNRIIAGLSTGTVVVESALRGGSMSTGRLADGYNRVSMAVPGRACDTYSEGTNLLIKSNVSRMVSSASDILTELDWMPAAPPKAPERDLSALGKDAAGLYACLPEGEAVGIEHLGTITGLSAGELAMVLMELQLADLIRVLPGNMYEKE